MAVRNEGGDCSAVASSALLEAAEATEEQQTDTRPSAHSASAADSAETDDGTGATDEACADAEPMATAKGGSPGAVRKASPAPAALPVPDGVLVIGIAGATRSGKSTLSKGLRENLPGLSSWVINQDKYFKMAGETPECIDFRRLKKDLSALLAAAAAEAKIKKRPQVVVVEGFLLFSDAALEASFAVKIFLELDMETCMARRKATKSCGVVDAKFDKHFEKVIWSAYEKHGRTSTQGVVKIDANQTPESVLSEALAAVQPVLDSMPVGKKKR